MNKKIFFASGGTGGHIFPAIGLVKYLKNKGYLATIGTDLRGLKYLDNNQKIKSYTVNADTPSKSISLKNFFSYFKILISIFKSILILKNEKPNLIIGFGGYVSFPYCAAGILLRIPIFLYENNLILGRANRHLLPFSTKILVSNDIINNYPHKYKSKISCVGHILREDFLKSTSDIKQKKNNKFTILIMGGSQGAEIFGKIIPEAIKKINNLGYKIKIYQQCTKNQKEFLINFYKNNNIECEIFYFTDNILELKASLSKQENEYSVAVQQFRRKLQRSEQNHQLELSALEQNFDKKYQHASQLQAENLLMSLQFPTGSSDLQPHYNGQIAALSEMLKQSPKLFIDLSGYTDKQGKKKLNQALSVARVNTVKNALIDQGVEAERIQLFAFGEQAPVVANSKQEVSFYDRRVVIKLHRNTEQVANNY